MGDKQTREPATKQSRSHLAANHSGVTQLSLVEHALCPLDSSVSLQAGFIQNTSYFYTDKNRNRKKASVRVVCPDGLLASDEFYLWGMLALTLSQPDAEGELFATPHYCLRQIGCIDGSKGKGSENYRVFRDAIERISAVSYQNDAFYDPIRGEHRRVGFGFLSYSLPLDSDSSRGWRFVWDPLFFELCRSGGSALSFDLPTYRQLDGASRRLYLLLKKVFWRHEVSPDFELRHLAVSVLGFSEKLETKSLKQKVSRCFEALVDAGIISLPLDAKRAADCFVKKAPGHYTISFLRGKHFDKQTPVSAKELQDSPFYDTLKAIGFDDAAMRRIVRTFKPRLIAEWADITLAARERNGGDFFTTGPEAYFMDNIKHASQGTRTPPDWWRQLRVQEERRKREAKKEAQSAPPLMAKATAERVTEQTVKQEVATDVRDAFERCMTRIFTDLRERGVPEDEARQKATHIARMNVGLRSQQDTDGPQRVFDLFGSR